MGVVCFRVQTNGNQAGKGIRTQTKKGIRRRQKKVRHDTESDFETSPSPILKCATDEK
jgi:hypothetical protein